MHRLVQKALSEGNPEHLRRIIYMVLQLVSSPPMTGLDVSCHRMLSAANHLALTVPAARYRVQDSRITIPIRKDSEFNIVILFCTGDWIVAFDDWHEEFQDLESAMKLVSQALSGLVRLRVDRIGGRPWRWTVERNDGSAGWIEIYSKAVFMLELGRTKDCVYRVITG